MVFAEHFMSRRSEEFARAAHLLLRGALGTQFWIFVVILGALAPICADSLADSIADTEHDCVCLGAGRALDVRESLDQGGPGCALELTRDEFSIVEIKHVADRNYAS